MTKALSAPAILLGSQERSGIDYSMLKVRQSEILTEFPPKVSPNLLSVLGFVWKCQAIQKNYFGFVVREFFELERTIKLLCFRYLENSWSRDSQAREPPLLKQINVKWLEMNSKVKLS